MDPDGIEVELDTRSAGWCSICRARSHSIVGWLHAVGGGTLAAYNLGWCESRRHQEIDLILTIGPWGDGADAEQRSCFPIVAWRDEAGAVQMSVQEHGRFEPSDTIGRRLDRDEALAHERIADVWALVDILWSRDPRVAEALEPWRRPAPATSTATGRFDVRWRRPAG